MSDSEDRTDGGSASGGRTTIPGAVSRRRLLASAAATGLGSGIATRAAAGATGGAANGSGADGSGWIRNRVWVETPVDTDGDGTNDRVLVRATLPGQTDEQVPVIATASPYYGEHDHGDTTEEMRFDRTVELSASDRRGTGALGTATGAPGTAAGATSPDGSDTATAGWSDRRRRAGRGRRFGGRLTRPHRLERRYVPQGYAVARVSSLGTHESTGCYTGAGPETAEALKAVVDWFNGRATAYDARRGGAAVEADWTNGKTGMIGTSAEGELANAVATTGVDGLEAIVPNSANNGQYSLFRSNGTPVSIVPQTTEQMNELSSWMAATNVARPDCDRWAERTAERQDYRTGDYNDFWHEREFLPRADAVEAAVLLSQGLSDHVVKPNNAVDWYEMLEAADVPVKLWLHRGGHRDPDSRAWNDLLDRWWAHWLKGVDNGVMDGDPVSVVHNGRSAESGRLDTYETWPAPDAEPATVGFVPGGATAGGVTATPAGDDATAESFVDDSSTLAKDLVAAEESDHRLRYESPPLGKRVHLSGKVVADLALSFDDPTVVSAALVEYAPNYTVIVTRGWADPLNRPRYGEHDSPVAYKQSLRESGPVDANERVRVEFPLQATDSVFQEGSRIGLVVYATDRKFTLHPPGDSTVTLSLADSEVTLPVVGGSAALADAFAEEPSGGTETPTATPAEGTATPGEGGTPTEREPTASATGTGSTTATTPGFGPGIASTVLGGAGYLLARARGGEESRSEE